MTFLEGEKKRGDQSYGGSAYSPLVRQSISRSDHSAGLLFVYVLMGVHLEEGGGGGAEPNEHGWSEKKHWYIVDDP